MGGQNERPKSPMFFLLIGIIYLINPIDFPTPIDDLIVNIVTSILAIRARMLCKKFDEVIQQHTGVSVDTYKALSSVVQNSAMSDAVAPLPGNRVQLEKMEGVFDNDAK